MTLCCCKHVQKDSLYHVTYRCPFCHLTPPAICYVTLLSVFLPGILIVSALGIALGLVIGIALLSIVLCVFKRSVPLALNCLRPPPLYPFSPFSLATDIPSAVNYRHGWPRAVTTDAGLAPFSTVVCLALFVCHFCRSPAKRMDDGPRILPPPPVPCHLKGGRSEWPRIDYCQDRGTRMTVRPRHCSLNQTCVIMMGRMDSVG